MYRFKEQYRDDKIVIPSIRLEVNKDNVNEYVALIFSAFPQHKEMIELVEEKKEFKKMASSKEEKPVSSPPSKLDV